MRAVPIHPMGHFPWKSHSHGQAWDIVFDTETEDLSSIPGRIKPKTIKHGIHSFPA